MRCNHAFWAALVCWMSFAQSAFPQQRATPSTPESVVRALLVAMKAGDATAIRAVFAPVASQAYGGGAPKSGEAFQRWLQSDIIDLRGHVSGDHVTVTGDEVVVTGQYSNSAGYASRANFLFRVADGRIVHWQMRY